MSAEREPQLHGPERSAEIAEAAQERLQQLAEQAPERSPENQQDRVERAREQLKQHEQAPPPAAEAAPTAQPSFTARLDRALNYTQTMASVQRRLTPASRAFSKVIHAPAVEKTSEVLGATVMRPSVTLGATWTALIVGLVFYGFARHYGYRLAGSELIVALIAGGILGAVIESLGRLVRRRR